MTRTWFLILGMSGIIVLFWFVGGGVALRFLVSYFLRPFTAETHYSCFLQGTVYRCHVMYVRSLGCHWYASIIQ